MTGGGYKSGACAQEECLCRQSTLYESIRSPKASGMYKYNFKFGTAFDSDYMLLSPVVDVFRNNLIPHPL
nr:poly(ADP-ribose) glycohydrolase domain-containing protein [uncultured Lachnoanaerobaculum sp.]